MSEREYMHDWSELAFGSKKPVSELKATFITAPRDISEARFTQLVKTYLPKGNILLGLAKERHIDGFEGQPQFQTLRLEVVEKIIRKVNSSSSPHKIHVLTYLQRELPFIASKIKVKRAVLVNGSWHTSFHLTPTYFNLINRQIPYELVSPFVDEAEAKTYAARLATRHSQPMVSRLYTKNEMLALADEAAKYSFDHTFQTGTALGKKSGQSYTLLATTFNAIVPYQTYAMHHGALREAHFSPANDLNYYDTNHAEVGLLLQAQKEKLSLEGTTLFINLMPCPTCARMLAESDIAHFIYQHDHSDGYAIRLFEAAGKRVERIVL